MRSGYSGTEIHFRENVSEGNIKIAFKNVCKEEINEAVILKMSVRQFIDRCQESLA